MIYEAWKHQFKDMQDALTAANDCPTWRYFFTPWVPWYLWKRWQDLASGEKWLFEMAMKQRDTHAERANDSE